MTEHIQRAISDLYREVRARIARELGDKRLSDIEDMARDSAIDLIKRKGHGPTDVDLFGETVDNTVQAALMVAFMLFPDMGDEDTVTADARSFIAKRDMQPKKVFQYKEEDRVQATQSSTKFLGTVIWVATCGRLQGTHPDDCQVVRVMWDAGNSQTFHATKGQIALWYRKPTSTAGPRESDMPVEAFEAPTLDRKVRILKQYKEGKMTTDEALDAIADILAEEDVPPVTDEKDFAYNLYMEALSGARDPWWKVYDNLAQQPYLVIGDFAYLLGYDGSYYQVPVKYVKGDNQNNEDEYVFTVMWREAVEVTEKMAPYLGRLMNVISDMGNISDIMRQSGVEIKTPKLCYRGELDNPDNTPQAVKNGFTGDQGESRFWNTNTHFHK